VFGRKRRALVNTDRRLLLAAVPPADLHDSRRRVALLRTSRRPWSFVALCYADRAYAGPRVAQATPIAVGVAARSGVFASSRGLHRGQGVRARPLAGQRRRRRPAARALLRRRRPRRENAARDVLASLTAMLWNAPSKSWTGGATMADASRNGWMGRPARR
jgi:hypothetical protein